MRASSYKLYTTYKEKANSIHQERLHKHTSVHKELQLNCHKGSGILVLKSSIKLKKITVSKKKNEKYVHAYCERLRSVGLMRNGLSDVNVRELVE